jgi:hypothetical protein
MTFRPATLRTHGRPITDNAAIFEDEPSYAIDLGQLARVNSRVSIRGRFKRGLTLPGRDSTARKKTPLHDGSNAMQGKVATILLSGLLFACAQPQPPAPPPPPPAPPPAQAAVPPPAPQQPANRFVPIRAVNCARLIQLSNEDRATAAMFYMGYQASRVGATAINVGQIPSMVHLALEYCTAYPDRRATEAFAYAYSVTRRE